MQETIMEAQLKAENEGRIYVAQRQRGQVLLSDRSELTVCNQYLSMTRVLPLRATTVLLSP